MKTHADSKIIFNFIHAGMSEQRALETVNMCHRAARFLCADHQTIALTMLRVYVMKSPCISTVKRIAYFGIPFGDSWDFDNMYNELERFVEEMENTYAFKRNEAAKAVRDLGMTMLNELKGMFRLKKKGI